MSKKKLTIEETFIEKEIEPEEEKKATPKESMQIGLGSNTAKTEKVLSYV